jgi:WD40 repeat protein
MEEAAELDDREDDSIGAVATCKYGVCYADGHIIVTRLDYPDAEVRQFAVHLQHASTKPILALSASQGGILATSDGPQITIYDLKPFHPVTVVAGIGRTVTALCWSFHCDVSLVSGHIDGTIALWNARQPDRPYSQFKNTYGCCHALALLPNNENVFAALHNGQLHIWDLLANTVQPMASAQHKETTYTAVAWKYRDGASTLAAASDNLLEVYDASNTVDRSRTETHLSASSGWAGDDELFGVLDGMPSSMRRLSSIALEMTIRRIEWVGNNVILGLSTAGRHSILLKLSDNAEDLAVLWTCYLERPASVVHLGSTDGIVQLVALGLRGSERHELPSTVVDNLQSAKPAPLASINSSHKPSSDVSRLSAVQVGGWNNRREVASGMKPISISAERRMRAGCNRLSLKHVPKRRSSRTLDQAQLSKAPIGHPAKLQQSPPMTSSLELPVDPITSDDGSPMPFLSPGIPAHKSPQTVIANLDDSIPDLLPLPDSLVGISPAVAAHDSQDDDSDDETFVDNLQTSGTFLPGGINVPLPKACGALFASNGQLLMFFPPRPRTTIERAEEMTVNDQASGPKDKTRKLARLFPAFGVFDAGARALVDEADSASSVDSVVEPHARIDAPSFYIQPSSFPSQRSWQARVSPTKPQFSTEQAPNKININVYEIDDPALSFRTEQTLAVAYRIMKEDGESGCTVCEHNSHCAQAAGLDNVSQIWRLLSMLLDDKVPLEVIKIDGIVDNVLAPAKRPETLNTTDPTTSLVCLLDENESLGHLRWTDNPFGGQWLIRKIFDWAEQRADLQLLACMAAVLTEPEDSIAFESSRSEEKFLQGNLAWSPDFVPDASALTPSFRRKFDSVPTLHADSIAATTKSSSLFESPSKQPHSSNTSSRNASQPTTPYLESTSITPPFFLPGMSRQGSRLSTSGSASPEAHRSSFSAAAKYYAQSFTDKFAAYSTQGTSPPPKKSSMSASPSNNELSTSLPSGSWSKSVSFATSSTSATTARGSLLSRSFDEKDNDEAYDSDRTVEDSSLPHTPRSVGIGIAVTHKNGHEFADEISGGVRQPLLPRNLSVRARYWCEYYADQLRTWGLLTKATELEKLVGLTHPPETSRLALAAETNGMLPLPQHNAHHVDICVVCTMVIRATQHLCPQCLHGSHLDCLEEYIAALDDNDFACPAGCGCNCSDLVHVPQELQLAPSTTRPVFKKNPSFTDPMRWRAKIASDGW